MLFRKKCLLILLAGSLAAPHGLSAENLNVNIPLLDGKLRMEIGIPGLILLTAGAMLIYGQYKSIRNFNKFAKRAIDQANQAVKAQKAASKAKLGKRYTGMDAKEVQAIREEAFKSFILDEASKRFKISGEDLKVYIDGMKGGTFEQKLVLARQVVDTLLVPQNSLDTIPGEGGGPAIKINSRSMIQYAVKNDIKTTEDAGRVTGKWTDDALKAGTLKTTTGGNVSRIVDTGGRIAGAGLNAAGRAAGRASEALYNVSADAANAASGVVASGLESVANIVDPLYTPATGGPSVGGGRAPGSSAYASEKAQLKDAPRVASAPGVTIQDMPTQGGAVTGSVLYPKNNNVGLAQKKQVKQR
jgi:hypothetical protein